MTDASGKVLAQQTMVLAKTAEALLDLTPETHSYYRFNPHQASSIANLPMFQVARDRQIIWIELDVRAVLDTDGKISYYEGLVQDITERKQREQTMQQQIEELRVEIDHEKRRQQVAEITETEYFQQLRREANYLRQRRPPKS